MIGLPRGSFCNERCRSNGLETECSLQTTASSNPSEVNLGISRMVCRLGGAATRISSWDGLMLKPIDRDLISWVRESTHATRKESEMRLARMVGNVGAVLASLMMISFMACVPLIEFMVN